MRKMSTDQEWFRKYQHNSHSAFLGPQPSTSLSSPSVSLPPTLFSQNLPPLSCEPFRSRAYQISSRRNMHSWSNRERNRGRHDSVTISEYSNHHQGNNSSLASQCDSEDKKPLINQRPRDPRLQKVFDFRNKVMPLLNDMIFLNVDNDAIFLQGLRLFHCIMDQHWYELTVSIPILEWLRILFPRFTLAFLRLNSHRQEDYIVRITDLLLIYTAILKNFIQKMEGNKVWAVVRQQARKFIPVIAPALLGRLDSVLNFLMMIQVAPENPLFSYLWRLIIKFYLRKARYQVKSDGDVVRLYIVWNKLISISKNIEQKNRFKREMYKIIGRKRLRGVPLVKEMKQRQKAAHVPHIREMFTLYRQWYNETDILNIRRDGPTMIEFPSNERYAYNVSVPPVESTIEEIIPESPIVIYGLSSNVDQNTTSLHEDKKILEQYKFDSAARSLGYPRSDFDDVVFVTEIVDLTNDDDQNECATPSNNAISSVQQSSSHEKPKPSVSRFFGRRKTSRSQKTIFTSMEHETDNILSLSFLNVTTEYVELFNMDNDSERMKSSNIPDTNSGIGTSDMGENNSQTTEPQIETVCEETNHHSNLTNVQNLLQPPLEYNMIIEDNNDGENCQQFEVSEKPASIIKSLSAEEGNSQIFASEITYANENGITSNHNCELLNDITTEMELENVVEIETLAESLESDNEMCVNVDNPTTNTLEHYREDFISGINKEGVAVGMQCQDEEQLSPITDHSEDTMESRVGAETPSLAQTYDLIMKSVNRLNDSYSSSDVQNSTPEDNVEIDLDGCSKDSNIVPLVALEQDTEEYVDNVEYVIDNSCLEKDQCSPVEDVQESITEEWAVEKDNSISSGETVLENMPSNETQIHVVDATPVIDNLNSENDQYNSIYVEKLITASTRDAPVPNKGIMTNKASDNNRKSDMKVLVSIPFVKIPDTSRLKYKGIVPRINNNVGYSENSPVSSLRPLTSLELSDDESQEAGENLADQVIETPRSPLETNYNQNYVALTSGCIDDRSFVDIEQHFLQGAVNNGNDSITTSSNECSPDHDPSVGDNEVQSNKFSDSHGFNIGSFPTTSSLQNNCDTQSDDKYSGEVTPASIVCERAETEGEREPSIIQPSEVPAVYNYYAHQSDCRRYPLTSNIENKLRLAVPIGSSDINQTTFVNNNISNIAPRNHITNENLQNIQEPCYEQRKPKEMISLANNPIRNNDSTVLHNTSRGNLNCVIDSSLATNTVYSRDNYNQAINNTQVIHCNLVASDEVLDLTKRYRSLPPKKRKLDSQSNEIYFPRHTPITPAAKKFYQEPNANCPPNDNYDRGMGCHNPMNEPRETFGLPNNHIENYQAYGMNYPIRQSFSEVGLDMSMKGRISPVTVPKPPVKRGRGRPRKNNVKNNRNKNRVSIDFT